MERGKSSQQSHVDQILLLKWCNNSNISMFSFHTCMFAAKRKKDTAIWTSVPQLRAYFRPTPYGFRQVVQHVSKHVANEIN